MNAVNMYEFYYRMTGGPWSQSTLHYRGFNRIMYCHIKQSFTHSQHRDNSGEKFVVENLIPLLFNVQFFPFPICVHLLPLYHKYSIYRANYPI